MKRFWILDLESADLSFVGDDPPRGMKPPPQILMPYKTLGLRDAGGKVSVRVWKITNMQTAHPNSAKKASKVAV